MLAKRSSRPASISVRCYLWSAEGPLRITERFHRDLIDGDVALPQYAGTKQKILELFVKHITSNDYSLAARGVIYPFDVRGFLDDRSYLQGALPEISRFRNAQANIVDLAPSIKQRRFRVEYTWRPTRSMLAAIRSDVGPGRGKVAVLRPLRGRNIGR
jgi:hypothetical protein